MKILWEVSNRDVEKVKAFMNERRLKVFVRRRIDKNLAKNKRLVTRSAFWRGLVSCLVTTQQRSGPGSKVNSFLRSDSFLLRYSRCKSMSQIERTAERELTRYRLRRSKVLASEIRENVNRIGSEWKEIWQRLDRLRATHNASAERSAAVYMQETFRGIGPKQSRNLLQALGLTRFEIPLDSRITKWMNSFGFPVKLTGQGLSDENYYSFVSDGIQELCRKARIAPCVLDAAIFSSFDKEDWTEENTV